TQTDYPKDKTIHQLFEEQVERTPNEIAVVWEGQSLTYKELNEKANQLARAIQSKGITKNSIVGIMVEPAPEMLIGIMAILKSGNTFLPMSLEIPIKRFNYIIEETNTELILTNTKIIDKYSFQKEVIDLQTEDYKNESIENLKTNNGSNDLAYIIYTSGSTGNPKGVMIEHRNIAHLSFWYNQKYRIEENKNTLQISNLSFDVSVLETIIVLLNQGRVFIPDRSRIFDKVYFKEYVDKHKINSIQFVPSTLKELVLDNGYMESLSVLISGGDKLDDDLKNKVIEMGYTLHNHYGPTETTVDTIITECNSYDVIGKPVKNSKVYIINKDGNLQPIGVPGEICIAGDGVGRGYYNNPELTKEKFIKDPHSASGTLYKTGDIGRWLADGNIEFFGRIDNQTKIRGIRIELGEIESQLAGNDDIRESVVDVLDINGEKSLCAYIVLKNQTTPEEIKAYLSNRIPQYMIPSHVVFLDKLPLNANGKLDRKSLPMPSDIIAGTKYAEPQTELEERLLKIWESLIISEEKIGVNDNFFELGGHSLKANIMVSMIHKEMNISIPLVKIFKLPTIRKLAKYISNLNQIDEYREITHAKKSDFYPLSRAQNRLFIMNQVNSEDTSYNMPLVYTVEGKLDVKQLEDAFEKLVNRHEILRTSFSIINGQPVQIVNNKVKSKVKIINQNDNESLINILTQEIEPFNLSESSLIKMTFINSAQGISALMLDMHHIISDGISMEIIIDELIKLYFNKPLPPVEVQYKDYCIWQQEILQSEEMKKMEVYWSDSMEGFTFTALPKRIETDIYNKRQEISISEKVKFNVQENKLIEAYCAENSITKFTFFTSILSIILNNEIGNEDITIGTPVSGRNHNQLQQTIGVFLNVLLLRTKVNREKSLKDYILSVNETVNGALENQNYPYEDFYDLMVKQYGIRGPLFSIMLNYLPYDDRNKTSHFSSEEGELVFTPYQNDIVEPKYDISIYVYENKEDIEIEIVHKDIFEDYRMKRIAKAFNFISDFIVRDSSILLGDIDYSILDEEDNESEEESLLDSFFNQKV
ncbi:amino acid adenylation domain-containing protein, partial [Lysinibacillus xylanilyticus]|uniref:amino acid adenylation domain-containing protein n=1 Tax=Lysinibacillus xylanilyticus TaxID=582475 RepID=UPI0038083BD8